MRVERTKAGDILEWGDYFAWHGTIIIWPYAFVETRRTLQHKEQTWMCANS